MEIVALMTAAHLLVIGIVLTGIFGFVGYFERRRRSNAGLGR